MICKKCQIDKQETEFLTGRDDKHLCVCKECVDKKFNPNDSATFMWILKELDIPYIEQFWKERRAFRENHEKPFTIGFYISYMKLASFRDWTWKESGSINQMTYEHKALQGRIDIFGEEEFYF
jgi:hypothetical protein